MPLRKMAKLEGETGVPELHKIAPRRRRSSRGPIRLELRVYVSSPVQVSRYPTGMLSPPCQERHSAA
jgi:hypothetical protein